MASFILTWNPEEPGTTREEVAAKITKTVTGALFEDRWSVGNRKGGIEPGDRLFLLRQHSLRGIVAAGVASTGVYQGRHWRDRSRVANYVDLEWEAWLDIDDRLDIDDLHMVVPGVRWDNLLASGVQMYGAAADDAERAWDLHLRSLDRPTVRSANELRPGHRYQDGAATRVLVNRYERDPRARAACIAHWGARCVVCHFDFGAVYGPIGDGYIHVHHLNDLALSGGAAAIDPRKDLRPVCANCHAMLHTSTPALSVASLKRRLHRQRAGRSR